VIIKDNKTVFIVSQDQQNKFIFDYTPTILDNIVFDNEDLYADYVGIFIYVSITVNI
jgi:hypothetical protein